MLVKFGAFHRQELDWLAENCKNIHLNSPSASIENLTRCLQQRQNGIFGISQGSFWRHSAGE
jgi:hypothetical protein